MRKFFLVVEEIREKVVLWVGKYVNELFYKGNDFGYVVI